MNWQFLVGLFAGPIGSMVNNAISAAGASVIGYSVAKGNPLGDITPIVSMIAVAVSTLIHGFANSQGIQIPIINSTENGVQVVKSGTGGVVVNAPLK
jgi:hypothetical protein